MYQILTYQLATQRWAFVAHGAAYSKADAYAYKSQCDARGTKCRLLPCGV